MKIPAWDGRDLADVLALEPTGPMQFRSRCGDVNAHGRAYGGQILGQALRAAALTVPPGKLPTMMQFLFLQGTLHDEAVQLQVTALQDGKRFSSRHVRGAQSDGRLVLDAQVSFAVELPAPGHSLPPAFASGEDPLAFPEGHETRADWQQALEAATSYPMGGKPILEFRLPDLPPRMQLDPAAPRLRFWLRLRQPLSDAPGLQAAAFAYLSDWWLNYPALGGHWAQLPPEQKFYVASLNHALWLHRPFRVDEWMHFDCHSPAAAAGRGLAVARIHNREGVLVASATQECLMAPSLR